MYLECLVSNKPMTTKWKLRRWELSNLIVWYLRSLDFRLYLRNFRFKHLLLNTRSQYRRQMTRNYRILKYGYCETQTGHPVRLISLVARPTIFNYHFLTRRWQHRWQRVGRGRKETWVGGLTWCRLLQREREGLVFIAYVLRVVTNLYIAGCMAGLRALRFLLYGWGDFFVASYFVETERCNDAPISFHCQSNPSAA
jgi:hypothetical protein